MGFDLCLCMTKSSRAAPGSDTPVFPEDGQGGRHPRYFFLQSTWSQRLALVQQLMLPRVCTLQSVHSTHSTQPVLPSEGVRTGRGRSASTFPDELTAESPGLSTKPCKHRPQLPAGALAMGLCQGPVLLLPVPRVTSWTGSWVPNVGCSSGQPACRRSSHAPLSKQGSTPVDKSFTRSQKQRTRLTRSLGVLGE